MKFGCCLASYVEGSLSVTAAWRHEDATVFRLTPGRNRVLDGAWPNIPSLGSRAPKQGKYDRSHSDP